MAGTNTLRPRGAYSVTTELWLADRFGQRLERVPNRHPVTGTIRFNDNVSVKRSLSLEVNDPHVFRAYNDFLIPVITLTDASGEAHTAAMGHFVALQPRSRLSPARYRGSIEAKGVEYLLQLDTIDGGMEIAAGTDTGAAARSLALDGGFAPAQLALPETGKLFAEPMYIDPGTTRLAAINRLYNVAGWYTIWSNGDGILRTAPWQDMSTVVATTRYSTHDGSIRVVGEVQEDPDITRIKNRVTVRNIAPEQEPIFATAEIKNREHPLHRDRIGIVIAETIDDPDVADPEAAMARAVGLLSEGASYYKKLGITTVLDLAADAHEIVDLDVRDDRTDLTGLWWRSGWSVELAGARGLTVHELNRVEPWQ